MSDISMVEKSIETESKTSPIKTHARWVRDWFHKETLKTEASIKGETMGQSNAEFFRDQFSFFLQALMTSEASKFSDKATDSSGMLNFFKLTAYYISYEIWRGYDKAQQIREFSKKIRRPIFTKPIPGGTKILENIKKNIPNRNQ